MPLGGCLSKQNTRCLQSVAWPGGEGGLSCLEPPKESGLESDPPENKTPGFCSNLEQWEHGRRAQRLLLNFWDSSSLLFINSTAAAMKLFPSIVSRLEPQGKDSTSRQLQRGEGGKEKQLSQCE